MKANEVTNVGGDMKNDSENGFSPETLRRIQNALDQVECFNPNYRMNLTADTLESSFGYGEGISVHYTDGKYYGFHNRERASDHEEYENEELASERFIRVSSAGKRLH